LQKGASEHRDESFTLMGGQVRVVTRRF
jgi:hypothetical protein